MSAAQGTGVAKGRGALTRTALAARVSAACGLGRDESREVVSAVIDALADALCSANRIELRGLGSLRPRHYPARRGVDPRSGAPLSVHARVVPVFRPARSLRARVQQEEGGA